MRKVIFTLFFSLLFFSCNMDDASPDYSLPKVNTSKYKTTTGFYFPTNSTALDIYSTLVEKFGEGKTTLSGVYSKTESTYLNGVLYSNTLTKTISAINIYKTRTDAAFKFYVVFSTDNGNLTYTYIWNHANTNAWTNTLLDGTISLTNP